VKVCLDTNVLVAAFAARGLCADVLRTVLSEHELVYGEVIRTEFRRALKTKLKLPVDRIASAGAVFAGLAVVPKPGAPHPLELRDRDDRWVLVTALAGGAEVLVTGDEDLLIVAAQAPPPVLSPREYWQLLRGGKVR